MIRSSILASLLFVFVAAPGASGGPEGDPPKVAAPKSLTGTLCQAWDSASRPEGATDRFFADNATVRLVFEASAKPGAGQRVFPSISTPDGKTVLTGNPLITDGNSLRWGIGFFLAGRDWARNGGEFLFELRWGDAKEPVLSLPFTVSSGKRLALLVGIADYPPAGPGGTDLPSTDKDAERMRDLLIGSFGFDRDAITLVTNLAATSGRIATELAKLAARAGPDDAVLFYYVGHGAQIPDLDGDEPDGWDEALATADVHPPLVTTKDQLGLFLSDDRLAELLGEFKTKNITVIFDSCHSGTAVREGEDVPAIEGYPVRMQTRPGFGRKLVQSAEDAPRVTKAGAKSSLDVDAHYVFIAAARSFETAVGLPAGGLFSARLREALRTSNGESWGDLVSRIRPAIHRVNPGQTPTATGAASRFPFSLAEAGDDAPFIRSTVAVVGAFDPEAPSILSEGLAGTHMAYVSGLSSLIGEQAGVLYDVYLASDPELIGPPRGRVAITGELAGAPRPGASPLIYATAKIIDGQVERGDRLVPRAVRVPGSKPAVGIFSLKDLGEEKKRLEAAATSLTAFLSRQASLVVKSGVAPTDVDYVVVPQVQSGKVVATVYTPSFTLVGSCAGSDAEIAEGVCELIVARHRTFTRISRIANPSPAFRLTFALEGGDGRRSAGQPLKLRGRADRPAHIYVFATLESGRSQLVAKSSGQVAAGKETAFEIPTRDDLSGRMALKVIATMKPLAVTPIEKAAPGDRGDALLAALRAVCPSPDGGDDLLSTEGWAAETIRVEFR